MPVLQVDNLRTYFSTDVGLARAVDGISFEVQEGETLGIVGESGCGKTVASLSIMGLIPPPGRIMPESSIRFREEELIGLPEAAMRGVRGNRIAMVFQEPMTSLNPVFTVGNQIQEALVLHRKLSRSDARAMGIELLSEVGIPEPRQRFDEYPHQLSGGMLQRVMIAIALSCEPDILIADEPTTALDVTIQAQILELLAELRTRRGMAVLLITHDLGVIAEVCDRVLVMYAGQIVESGTVEEVFVRPSHPYTEGLLRSLPKMTAGGGRLHPILGTVPSSVDWPAGCRFRTRCPYTWARCGSEMPPLIPLPGERPGRLSRCWLGEEPQRRVPTPVVLAP
jgi:oligopeptide/dipeptide ABC transporter ATP-binding protein